MSQTTLPVSRKVVVKSVVVDSALEEMELSRLRLWIMMVMFSVNLYLSLNSYCIPIDMIIGFRQRSQTIIERDMVLSLDVHSLRFSELDYEVQFHLQQRSRSSTSNVYDHFDVQFVNGDNASDPVIFSSKLPNFSLDLAVVPQVYVQNDSSIEPEDCYTIVILSPDNVESFTCNIDENNSTDLFCLHTICIEDDDG